MKCLLTKLWNDECGIVISTEMVVITSITLLATIVGLESLANAIAFEFNDIGNALTSIVQSYSFTGFQGSGGGKTKSSYSGSSFQDTPTTTTLSVVGSSTTIVNQAADLQNSDINSLSVAEGIQTVNGQSTESVLSEEPVGSLGTLSDESCNESVNSLGTLENADCDQLRDLVRRLQNEINQSTRSSSSTRSNSSSNSSSTNDNTRNNVDELLGRDAR